MVFVCGCDECGMVFTVHLDAMRDRRPPSSALTPPDASPSSD
jgi:hypothetical protein